MRRRSARRTGASRAWPCARGCARCRDRLTVEAAAQLPELLRGVFYGGWSPGHVPKRDDRRKFIARFARDAGIGRDDVPKAAAIVTEAAASKISSGADFDG